MPAATLPARANLEFLRKQSKDLRRAFRDGETEALECIRRHLPRAAGLSDEQLRQRALSLQEAQHALAREYGYGKWEELLAAVDLPSLDDLHRLRDRDVQILLREADQQDVARMLAVAAEPVRAKFLANVSHRVRLRVQEEIDSFGAATPEAVESARERIRAQLAEQKAQGWLTWPPPAEVEQQAVSSGGALQEALARAGKPLHELSVDAISEAIQALATVARDEGILAMDRVAQQGAPTLLTEGITLAVDGTEPDLVVDMLEIRAATILRNRTIRGQMAIEGWMSIHSGDHPAIVERKLQTYFVEEPQLDGSTTGAMAIDELLDMLRQTPLARQSLPQLVDFYRGMAAIRRRDGFAALAPLVADVDDPVLLSGMQRVGPEDGGGDADVVLEAMESRLHEERRALHQRHCLVIKGIVGIQEGRPPEAVVAEARAWAAAQAATLEPQGPSRPGTPGGRT